MTGKNYPDKFYLKKQYDELADSRDLVIKELVLQVMKIVHTMPSHPSVKARIKDFDSYYKKYLRILKDGPPGKIPVNEDSGQIPLEYNEETNAGLDPSRFILDIIGIRVVCPFLEDLAIVEELLKENFLVLEVERKGGDHTFREFGYESVHLLIKVPDKIVKKCGSALCGTAEIQIRTILQDAWAEVEHELVYKADFNPFDNPMKRKLAAVNASLSLADIIFQEIRSYQRQLNNELEKRRDSFFQKIEETTDALILADIKPPEIDNEPPKQFSSNESIDELLLNALYAHNKLKYSEAITFYTRILELNPDDSVKSLILKHRGMAFFARSHYEQAITDFAVSLELDPSSYKAAYYRGIVLSVLKKYQESIDAFDQSLDINPYQPFCLFRRGQAWYHLEDYPRALSDCESALALESFESAQKFRQLVLNKLRM
ncbi:MAG: tetratricopeptide repeat protein [Treponema sp.]|nr:tetratricopeptide repeat protein [Treponema sp.]